MTYKLQLNEQYKEFENELINIKEIFNDSYETIHKARNELKIIELKGQKCVVKSFKVPHFINRIAYTFFRDGKAKKSFSNAIKLFDLNISTPEPIGVIEFFSSSLLSESYFITLYQPYDFTIREVFHHKVDDVENILKQFAAFTYNLHQKGVWHVDYSLGNILITKQENREYIFSLVDINRMVFKPIPVAQGLKNFNKFWPKYKTDLDVIAKEYARLSNFPSSQAIDIIHKASQKLQARVNQKRKLKSLK